jgi:hypothetical protein
MKKIPSLFARNYDGDRLVRDEVVPGSEWVIQGEGIPTRKFDGTAILIQDGKIFQRYDAKKGRQPPSDFQPAQPEPDPVTGHWPGWILCTDKRALEAVANHNGYVDGTYELVGPKVNGNPERFEKHALVRHGSEVLGANPRSFESIRDFLDAHDYEGIVWHHPVGRMVKIKKKDFGLRRTREN